MTEEQSESDGPPPASVRDDLTILGLCSMYECSDPARYEVRWQPEQLGGLVIDVTLCPDHTRDVEGRLGRLDGIVEGSE